MKKARKDPHQKASSSISRPRVVTAAESRKILNDLHKPVETSKAPRAV